MAARMGLLVLVVLALARPFWARKGRRKPAQEAVPSSAAHPATWCWSSTSPRAWNGRATAPARLAGLQAGPGPSRRCRPGDSIAVLLAGDGVQRLIDPPTYDMAKIDCAHRSSQITKRCERPAGGPGRAFEFSNERRTRAAT